MKLEVPGDTPPHCVGGGQGVGRSGPRTPEWSTGIRNFLSGNVGVGGVRHPTPIWVLHSERGSRENKARAAQGGFPLKKKENFAKFGEGMGELGEQVKNLNLTRERG